MKLAPVFLGSLGQRRMATLFSFVAIVLGVALGMAVQAVHEAALSEFGRGLRNLSGTADLQVVGPRGGFAETLDATLASRPEIAEASPILEIEAKLVGREQTLQVLGVDVFALARVTPALLPRPAAAAGRFAVLAEDSIFLAAAAPRALGVQAGDPLLLQSGTQSIHLTVAGDLPGAADNSRLAVIDIAALQAHFARLGRLSRIDLRLAQSLGHTQSLLGRQHAQCGVLWHQALTQGPAKVAFENREPAVGRSGLALGMALGKVGLQVVLLRGIQRQPMRQKQPSGQQFQIPAVGRQSVGGQSILQPEGIGKTVDGRLAGFVHGPAISPA